ncbi:MAG: histidine kinase [Chloroflexales bacterium]|nr:histidine kinase [Chloroflexales bacterium]
MGLVSVTPVASGSGAEPDEVHLRLRSVRLHLARATWIVLVVTALLLYVASVPLRLAELQQVCGTDAGCADGQITLEQAQVMADPQRSIPFYATYTLILDLVTITVSVAAGLLIFWRKPDNWMALFAALMLVLQESEILRVLAADPIWWFPAACMTFLGSVLFLLFGYLFPNGRFVPRWTQWLALLVLVIGVSYHFLPDSPVGRLFASLASWIALVVTAISAQLYRYWWVSSPRERQQTRWLVLGVTLILLVGGPLALIRGVIFPDLIVPGSRADLAFATLSMALELVIPVSLVLAILRSRLWDVDPLLNRTLVYGALTACVVGLYVLVVSGLGALLAAQGNPLLALLATGLVAVLFQPLRAWLQRAINRLMYGDRDDPYAALARLGQRLEATLAHDAVLPTIVQTVRETLKVPYAAIALVEGTGDAMVTTSGVPTPEPLCLPLSYRGARLGQLLVGPRAVGEGFTPADLRLLNDLARQAGSAIHAVQLTAHLQRMSHDLQQSREGLVLAREEERRRLRRDLHDDLAPTLAGLALTARIAQSRLSSQPAAAVDLLSELHAGLRTAVGDIRRLAYDLRPPALDEFGLVAALRERVAQYTAAEGSGTGTSLAIAVVAPEPLPPLPAAVEVAAYRICQEAVMNVLRHAQARTCQLRITHANGLTLEITDDGVGIPADYRPGVGVRSMHERAAELGGTCVVAPHAPCGTRITVWLPLRMEEQDGATTAADR